MRFYRRRKNRLNKIKNAFRLTQAGRTPDYLLLGVIFFILVFGLVMLSSASSVESFRDYGDAYYLFRHQLIFGFVPGLVLFFILSKIDYSRWQKYLLPLLVASLALLTLVFIPGIGANYGRAQSWINIAGFSFQPTEIIKLLLVLILSSWFAQRSKELTQDFWNGLLPFAFILALISLPIVLQPDIGTLMVIVATAFTIYFVAGGRWKHVLSLAVLGLGAVALLIVQAPYRAARLLTFLNPGGDPQGAGYHISQAFLAVGSGGWFGLGLGQSRQKFAYLPEVMGDSIFAVIAEEIGFIFSSLLIIAFIVLLLRGMKLAQSIEDPFGRYVTVGIIAWFSWQAFFNIGAMVGLLPLTGIPLPFVSYGGTALMSSLAAAGILANISRQV